MLPRSLGAAAHSQLGKLGLEQRGDGGALADLGDVQGSDAAATSEARVCPRCHDVAGHFSSCCMAFALFSSSGDSRP